MAALLDRLFRRQSPADRVRLDADRRSTAHPEHHWTFDSFEPFSGQVPEGMYVDFLGDLVRAEVSEHDGPSHARQETAALPPVDEEYFEWTDILEAALAAQGTFTFLELGAGWGRWSARAAMAARRLGKPLRLGLAEGDPKNVRLIHDTMAINGVTAGEYRVYEAAIGGEPSETVFCIGNPREGEHWYGQSAVGGVVSDDFRVGEYHGRPMFQIVEGGAQFIRVPQITLSTLLADYDFVDLADLDLQTAEREAVPEALDALSAKVRRMHIGTHSAEIEAGLRETLAGAGWVCLRDYPGGQSNETTFGPCYFVDGVQTWINPRRL